jgi:glycopeptide antibiotics resistance protein
MTERRPYPRRPLLLLAVAYLVFVIYGSLVPLDYRALPLEEALARFREIPYLTLGIGSRADWVANILLFVPLAFLWLGAVWHRWNAAARLTASLAVLLAAVVLSVGIEFTQLFFPPRTVSQNDILAEAIGALLGLLAWWLWGPRLMRWAQGCRADQTAWAWSERLLYVYLFGLFAYSVLPLDLTLSPVELFHKLKEGRIVLLPFGGLPADPAQAVYDVLSDIAIWVPAGFVWQKTLGAHGRALRRVLLAALLLEFLQLWVYSRVTDVTDIFTALLGGALGMGLARRYFGATASGAAASGRSAMAWGLGAALLWLGVLAGVFWYPYDFRLDGSFLRERLPLLGNPPFTAYYYGTEFRAVTEVLHKSLFFLPLGAALGLAATAVGGVWRRAALAIALALIVSASLAIEGGKLLIPSKHFDWSNVLLEVAGAAAGLMLAALLWRRRAVSPAPR